MTYTTGMQLILTAFIVAGTSFQITPPYIRYFEEELAMFLLWLKKLNESFDIISEVRDIDPSEETKLITLNITAHASHFTVSSGLTSVRPNYQMGKKIVASHINDESGVQANFHRFFDSITRNDRKRTKNYRNILKQDAGKEQQAFDMMKEELQFARQKNARKQRHVNPADGNVVISKREIRDDQTTMASDAIDDGWIRSQTLTTNYHLTLPRRTVATTQTQPAPQPSSQPSPQPQVQPQDKHSNDSKHNAMLGFQLIDVQYAMMRPSEKFPDFSRIREDTIFLKYFSELKQSSNATEDFLLDMSDYFERWPTVSVDKWKEQLSPDEMSRYLEYAKKYEQDPPPLMVRWTILVTWLMRSTEWKDPTKIPEPMLSRFILLSQEYNRLSKVRAISVIEIGKGVVQAFLNGFVF